MLHIALHFVVPVVIAGLFFRNNWKLAYFIMISTILVDVDHLLATPIYDAERCSIGFHPLHQLLPIILYGILCLIPKTRYLGIGLVLHMALDSLDCQMTNGVWFVSGYLFNGANILV